MLVYLVGLKTYLTSYFQMCLHQIFLKLKSRVFVLKESRVFVVIVTNGN